MHDLDTEIYDFCYPLYSMWMCLLCLFILLLIQLVYRYSYRVIIGCKNEDAQRKPEVR